MVGGFLATLHSHKGRAPGALYSLCVIRLDSPAGPRSSLSAFSLQAINCSPAGARPDGPPHPQPTPHTLFYTHTHTLPQCVSLALSSVSHLLCDLGQVLFLSGPVSAICTMKSLGSVIGGGPASLMSCGPTLSVDPSPFLTTLRLQVHWVGPQIPESQEVLEVPWISLSPVSESHNIP